MSYDYTVLAQKQPLMDFKPQLISFSGGEREDFRHFRQILETYLELSNNTTDSRKLAILKIQVRKSAKTFLDSLKDQLQDGLTFDLAMDALEKKFVTAELLESYKLILNNMRQGADEHPRDFYSRLQEVARLANKDDNDIVLMRFRYGLLPVISKHCIEHGSITEQQWLKYAESWWNANKAYGSNNNNIYDIGINHTTTDVQLHHYPFSNESFNMIDSSHRNTDTNLSAKTDPVVTLLERLVTNMETMEKNMNDKIEQINQSTKKSHKSDNLTNDDIVKIVRSELSKSNRNNGYYHGSNNYNGSYKNNYGSRRYNNQQYNQDYNYDNNNNNYVSNQTQHQQHQQQQYAQQQFNQQQQHIQQQTHSKN